MVVFAELAVRRSSQNRLIEEWLLDHSSSLESDCSEIVALYWLCSSALQLNRIMPSHVLDRCLPLLRRLKLRMCFPLKISQWAVFKWATLPSLPLPFIPLSTSSISMLPLSIPPINSPPHAHPFPKSLPSSFLCPTTPVFFLKSSSYLFPPYTPLLPTLFPYIYRIDQLTIVSRQTACEMHDVMWWMTQLWHSDPNVEWRTGEHIDRQRYLSYFMILIFMEQSSTVLTLCCVGPCTADFQKLL